MCLEAAFLADILEHSDDDTPRLVYADWLDDHGRSVRAEFIRVQCAFARLSRRDPARHDLRRRLRELYADPEKRWRDELPPITRGFWSSRYHRGFVDEVTFSEWDSFTEHADALVNVPVRRVSLPFLTVPNTRLMADSPLIERIREMHASVTLLDETELRTLAGSPRLRNLVALGLVCGGAEPRLGSGCGAILGESSHLAGLRELSLHTFDLFDAGARDLAASPHLKQVSKLTLFHSRISATGAADVFGAPWMQRLESLTLDFNPIGSDGARALARAAASGRLEVLSLAGCRINSDGVIALAEWPGFASLAELALGSNDIGPAGVAALADSPHLDGLVSLDLSRSQIGDQGAEILADAKHLRNLEMLLLPVAGVSRQGAEAMLRSPNLEKVTLGFRKQDMPPRDQQALLSRYADRISFDWR